MAWTRAQLHSAHAHVELLDSRTAHVALTIGVRVTGGWLSELELPGIAADVVPDADKPPTMLAVTGEKYAPELTLHRGVWRVTFADKRSAPWRGDYKVSLSYRQPIVAELPTPDVQRVLWSMPAWRHGIEEPRIWISAPSGSRSVHPADSTASNGESKMSVRGRTLFTHRRSQLPRDTEWSVAVDVPVIATTPHTAEPVVAVATIDAAEYPGATITSEWLPASVWLPTWLLAFAWLKRRLTRVVAKQKHFTVQPLVPLSHTAIRLALTFTLAAAASTLWAVHPTAAAAALAFVVLLHVDRSFDWPPARDARWSAALGGHAGRVYRARAWLRGHAWMDATLPTGAITLACAYGVLGFIARLDPRQTPALAVLALLMTPLWTTATRLHMPWDGARIAQNLTRWLKRHRSAISGAATDSQQVLLCLDEHACARDARLPLRFAHTVVGVEGIDLTLVTDARSLRRRVALLVQVVDNSQAEAVLRHLPESARHSTDGRSFFVVPPEQIVATMNSLASIEHGRSVRTIEPDRVAA